MRRTRLRRIGASPCFLPVSREVGREMKSGQNAVGQRFLPSSVLQLLPSLCSISTCFEVILQRASHHDAVTAPSRKFGRVDGEVKHRLAFHTTIPPADLRVHHSATCDPLDIATSFLRTKNVAAPSHASSVQ